jgi:hypothetical protein
MISIRSWPSGIGTIAVFWGYFDESGTHDKPEVFALAGYVASTAEWEHFEREWSQVLQSEGVRIFHMAPLCARPRRGEFKGWTDAKAEVFLSRVLAVIEHRALFGFAAFVRKSDFAEILRPALVLPRDRIYKRPYILCMQSCMSLILEHFPSPPYNPGSVDKIACVFDRNHEMRSKATDHFWEIVDARNWGRRFQLIAFAPKRFLTPLQAADLLAYETYRYGTDALTHPDLPRRPEILRLSADRRIVFNYIDRGTLTELAEKLETDAVD